MRDEDREGSKAIGTKISSVDTRIWPGEGPVQRVTREHCGAVRLFCNLILVVVVAVAAHSSALAWNIPWMKEPGGLQSMGSHRVGHD